MRLLLITQYFWPESFRVNDLVEGLVERGHEVTVLTGQPNYPTGRFYSGYGWRGPARENYSGAAIFRVPLFARGSGSGLRLALNYLSFVVFSLWGIMFRLPRDPDFDAIFVFEPSPVTVGIPAAFARWRYRVPMLFWVLDLWPESLTATEAVKSKFVLSLVARLVQWIYSKCDQVLVQSQAFIPEICKYGIDRSRVRYFPNWGEAVLEKSKKTNPIPTLPDGFRIIFTGNIGAAQDFPSILDAATKLRHRSDIHWIIVGEGRMAAWARAQVVRRGLGNTVHFLGQHPLDTMPAFFTAADAVLLSLRNEPVFSLTVPGKLQSYLAAGQPVLAMLDGEGCRIIDEAEAGLSCPAGDSGALALAAKRLADMPAAERSQLGDNARLYFAQHFEREGVFDRLELFLRDAVKNHRAGGGVRLTDEQ